MTFKYKSKTSPSQIKQVHAKYMEHVRDAIIKRFTLIGWKFVKMAREKTAKQGGFDDHSGNLRSSIGFVVVDHGEIVYGDFEPAKKGKDQETGLKEAKKLTRELASNFSEGYALIVVAGMDYAAAVESKGKDVITGSSLQAEIDLKDAVRKMKMNGKI